MDKLKAKLKIIIISSVYYFFGSLTLSTALLLLGFQEDSAVITCANIAWFFVVFFAYHVPELLKLSPKPKEDNE